MMRLGASTWCFRKEPLPQALEKISSLGVGNVELFANVFHLDPRLGKPDIFELTSRLASGNLVPLSLHMPFAGIQGNGTEHSALKAWRALVEDCLPIVEALGIPTVVIHPQIRTSDRGGRAMILDTVGVIVEAVLPRLSRIGAHVLLENLPSSLFSGYWAGHHFREMFERENQAELGMCFDISHCIGSGLDLFEEIRACLPWVREIHMSDNRPGSGVDLHLPLHQGQTDWAMFFAFLKAEGFEGDIMLEIDGGEDAVSALGESLGAIREMVHDR